MTFLIGSIGLGALMIAVALSSFRFPVTDNYKNRYKLGKLLMKAMKVVMLTSFHKDNLK